MIDKLKINKKTKKLDKMNICLQKKLIIIYIQSVFNLS